MPKTNIRSETEAQALKRRLDSARTENKQEFCGHEHRTSVWYEGSQERITCTDCGKQWWD